MKNYYTILILLLSSLGFHTEVWSQDQIEWITIEEALEKFKTEPRKILIDVHLSQDNWCEKMDSVTYKKKQIIKYVNANFYAVKLNAEFKESIKFKGKTYEGAPKGGYHELALEFTEGMKSFPSIVFLDEKCTSIQTISGFLNCMKFEMVITYFARNKYEEIPWEKYQDEYTPLRMLEADGNQVIKGQ